MSIWPKYRLICKMAYRKKQEIAIAYMLPRKAGRGPNPSTKRRKSEAKTHDGNDSPTHHSRGGRNMGDKIKMDPQ